MALTEDPHRYIQNETSPLLELRKGNILKTIWVDVDPKYEDEFLHWYNEEHESLLWKVPGVLGMWKAKRLGEEGQKYFYLYTHQNMDVQKTELYRQASLTEWAKKIYPFLKNFDSGNYEIVMVKGVPKNIKKNNIIRTVEVDISPEYEREFSDWLNSEHIPILSKVSGVLTIWQAVNLGKGAKYLTAHFHESKAVQERDDYKKASQTEWLEKLRPYLKNLVANNYEIMVSE